MQRVELKIAMANNQTETRTAYMLPETAHGVRFAVVRDDSVTHPAKWSVSQFDTGLKSGPDCWTRKDAIKAHNDRLYWLADRKGADFVAQKLRDTVAEYPTINEL
jgi:hypothetical protein|tara:strand:+ start:418 stop:732 length:315 start_codon:yes stop_codon:yes gene_type:complete